MSDGIQTQINISEAKIATATVTIQHLMVKDRKLTKAVFRQIKEECLIDFEKREFLGPVWGHVNYWWDCLQRTQTSLHVVWQKGEELRRFVMDGNINYVNRLVLGGIEKKIDDRKLVNRTLWILDWLKTHDYSNINSDGFNVSSAKYFFEEIGLIDASWDFDERFVRQGPIDSRETFYARSYNKDKSYGEYEEEYSKKQLEKDRAITKAIQEREEELSKTCTIDTLRAQIKFIEDWWASLYEQIHQSPHLYIAT